MGEFDIALLHVIDLGYKTVHHCCAGNTKQCWHLSRGRSSFKKSPFCVQIKTMIKYFLPSIEYCPAEYVGSCYCNLLVLHCFLQNVTKYVKILHVQYL